MKNFNIKFLGLGLVIIQTAFLMSCGQNNNNSSGRCDTIRNPSGCGGGVTTQTNTDIALQGLFTGTNQDYFQTNAAGLVSATITANALGKVNDGTSAPDNTGIAFGAKVSVGAGHFTSLPANSQVTTGRLLIAVYDDLVGQVASTGQVIGPIEIPFSTATGTAGGGAANISFKDNFGTINFTGNYDSNNFTGTVNYSNTTVVGGGQAVSGNFQFQIPTCSFFACN